MYEELIRTILTSGVVSAIVNVIWNFLIIK